MEAEMRQQPAVLAAMAERFSRTTAQVATLVAAGGGSGVPAGVAFLARGSSDHAALLGRYAVELQTGLPTCLVAPSVATAYHRAPDGFRGWLLVALSQSGRTPEIVDLAERYTAAGARVVAVTNDVDSALARAAGLTIALEAGPERAVPATKTVTSQMLAALAVASGLGPGGLTPAQAATLPDAVDQILADPDGPDQAARLLADHDRLAVVGRSACYPAALEGALKLQETTGLMAHGFSTADFRHGPIAVCGPNAPALLLAGSGPADRDTLDLRTALAERRAPVLLAGTAPEAQLPWPALGHLGECLLATVRGQQLALATSRRLGVDPDQPTGLNKVTLTS
jgi:glucosamine--fructose-6-phosphate aminotransferase (isomerizing)